MTDMKFVHIEPGTFMMGSQEDEPERFDNEKQHEVILTKGFYMQTTPVTQGQWEAVMGENPSRFKECGKNYPVENVSWNDAQEFIKKLNEQDANYTYRLPTEAEWEYACRAGTQTAYYTGDDEADLAEAGWYIENSDNRVHPVGEKAPNAFGLYDMHGNVWEWCQDWYDNYPTSPVTDPVGPKNGSSRVIRGGGWDYFALYCRSAYRSLGIPDYRYDNLGFRLVKEGVEMKIDLRIKIKVIFPKCLRG